MNNFTNISIFPLIKEIHKYSVNLSMQIYKPAPASTAITQFQSFKYCRVEQTVQRKLFKTEL